MFTFLTGYCYRTCGSTDQISMLIFAIIAIITLAILHISIFVINWKDRNFQNSIHPSTTANQSFRLSQNNSGSKKDQCLLITIFLMTVQCVVILFLIQRYSESNPYALRMMTVSMPGFVIPCIFALTRAKIRAFLIKIIKETKVYNFFLSSSLNVIHPQCQS